MKEKCFHREILNSATIKLDGIPEIVHEVNVTEENTCACYIHTIYQLISNR